MNICLYCLGNRLYCCAVHGRSSSFSHGGNVIQCQIDLWKCIGRLTFIWLACSAWLCGTVHGRSLSFSHGENVIHSAETICESAQVATSYFSTGYVVHSLVHTHTSLGMRLCVAGWSTWLQESARLSFHSAKCHSFQRMHTETIVKVMTHLFHR